MSFLFATFWKDISRWRQDYSAILIWLGIPFLIGGLLTMMMSQDDGGGPIGTLLIADLDDSLLSGFAAGAFSQDEFSDLLGVQQVSEEEGAELIEAGEASGLLIIPKGFQEAFLNETPIKLTLKTNPSQTILPGIIEDVTSVLLDAGFYLQATFGPEIAEIQDVTELETPSDLFVSDMAVQIRDKLERLGPRLSPLPFDVLIVAPPPTEPRPDLALLFLPGIVLMALMFAAQGLAGDYWQERDSGALRRLVSTPGLLSRFVLGKAMAAGVIVVLIGGLTLFLGFLYHDVMWQKFLPSMLWITLSGIGLFAWFSALQMFLPNSRSANLLSTIVVFPLLMMGGSFFPLEALPDWMATIGRMSPNGFVVDRLGHELTSATAWSFDLKAWSIIAAMTVSGLAMCSWRLQTGFARR